MNNYNPNIHHRKSIPLRGYDYSKAGLYYITICTAGRKCFFGKIVPVGVENFQSRRQEMISDDAGKIADSCWLQIPEHFPEAFLHEYVVMPNHIHGIIELKKYGNEIIMSILYEMNIPMNGFRIILKNE